MDILLESEHIVATTALTFLYTIFILLGRQDRSMRETKRTMTVIEDQLKVYISWKFIVSAVSGFIIGVTLSHLGIDLAAVFGLLTVSAHPNSLCAALMARSKPQKPNRLSKIVDMLCAVLLELHPDGRAAGGGAAAAAPHLPRAPRSDDHAPSAGLPHPLRPTGRGDERRRAARVW